MHGRGDAQIDAGMGLDDLGDRLLDKTALADARRTDDGDHARLAGGDHILEQGGNRIQIKPAPDERGISWHIPFGYHVMPG